MSRVDSDVAASGANRAAATAGLSGAASPAAAGSVSTNRVPVTPSTRSMTCSSPPSNRASRLQIARPRPDDPTAPVRAAGTTEPKSANSASSVCPRRPGPPSSTSMLSMRGAVGASGPSDAVGGGRTRHTTRMGPHVAGGAYLTAFVSPLVTICRTRTPSVDTCESRSEFE